MAEILQFPAPPTATAALAEDDAPARAEALDTSRSFVVEAPAGSGKTGLLMQRLLRLLAVVDDPERVLAITFTRKATAELRERVLAQLLAARTGEPAAANSFDQATRALAEAVLDHDRARGWNLLEQPARLNIRTIDSVAGSIARSLPVLSGAGGSLQPADQPEELYEEAARRTVLLLGDDGDPALDSALRTVLLHRDNNLGEVRALIAGMLGWREQWAALMPVESAALDDAWLDGEVLPRFERALDLAICRALSRMVELIPPADLHQLCGLAAEMAAADGNLSDASPMAICRGRHQPPAERADHLDHWRALLHLLVTADPRKWRKQFNRNYMGIELLKHHKQELLEIIQRLALIPGLNDALCALHKLPPAQYPAEQWHVAKALFRVLWRALVELQLVFTERGESDFTEQALTARHALAQEEAAEDLLHIPALRLDHLLVDEMQDTSTGQYDLLSELTRGWDGSSQTVFLVGDPRQSIYLFRQARVERFEHVLHSAKLGGLPLTRLRLTRNFRSEGGLVEDFNRDFAGIFPAATASADQEAYQPALAARARSGGSARTWHATLLPRQDPDAAALQGEADAAAIAALCAAWRARPLPPERTEPWKLAVLVRSRTHLLPVVRALEAAAVPYRAVNVEPLGERQEILDLLALARALLHPADRTAWLGLLRTPFCGLGLADLHLLASDPTGRAESVPALLAARAPLLSAEAQARLAAFLPAMAAASAERGRLPIALWVERTARRFAAEHFQTAEESGNVQAFLDLLAALERGDGTVDLDRLAERLGELYATPANTPGAVDLMTVHGAKGLEWDLVCVPALERCGRGNSARLLTWLELEDEDGQGAPGILAPIQSKGTGAKLLNTWMRSVDSAREEAERKRLFYVAATRAREELHLFAAMPPRAKGDIEPPAGSLLASAWPAAQEVFAGLSLPAATPDASLPEEALLALAAAASVKPPSRIAQIPLEAMSAPAPLANLEPEPLFERPQGSLAARALGNTLHAFLDRLGTLLADGVSDVEAAGAVSQWLPRIRTVLAGSGLPPAQVGSAAASVLLGLERTLADPDGRWLLHPHVAARNEQAVTVQHAGGRSTIRLDRTFRAGPAPHAPGDSILWIVDWKTATHGADGLEDWLARQRAGSAPQLETYARLLGGGEVRLALYYPLLARLDWWVAGGAEGL